MVWSQGFRESECVCECECLSVLSGLPTPEARNRLENCFFGGWKGHLTAPTITIGVSHCAPGPGFKIHIRGCFGFRKKGGAVLRRRGQRREELGAMV